MHNDFYRSPDSVGYPISGVSVRLIEQNEDGTGELAVKGPNVMLGYYKKPEETAAVLQDGWFRTGDMAHRNREGSYSIVGRTKSMIVTQNGKKIFPEEIEYHLTQDPLVSDALVWGEAENGDITVVASVYPDYPALEERLAKEGVLPETPEYDNAIAEWSKKLQQLKFKRLLHGEFAAGKGITLYVNAIRQECDEHGWDYAVYYDSVLVHERVHLLH